jgi:hypothetical protein
LSHFINSSAFCHLAHIEPFITNIPEETLEFTLGATRKAMLNSGKG